MSKPRFGSKAEVTIIRDLAERGWTCEWCGKIYDDPEDVPPICPDCGKYSETDPE